MKAALAAMQPEIAAAKSQAACARIASLDEFHRANAILLYLPIPGEVDTTAAALAAWQADKTVLAPNVSFEHKHMLPVVIHSLDGDLFIISHGLREPIARNPWPIEEIDLVIVPALAYDRRGGRLGRGGGIYDRFLARENFQAVTCGLAFDEQILDEVPNHPHDLPVDMVVTDKEVMRFDPTCP